MCDKANIKNTQEWDGFEVKRRGYDNSELQVSFQWQKDIFSMSVKFLKLVSRALWKRMGLLELHGKNSVIVPSFIIYKVCLCSVGSAGDSTW